MYTWISNTALTSECILLYIIKLPQPLLHLCRYKIHLELAATCERACDWRISYFKRLFGLLVLRVPEDGYSKDPLLSRKNLSDCWSPKRQLEWYKGIISSFHIQTGSREAQLIVPTAKWARASRTVVQLRLEPSLLIEGLQSASWDGQEKNDKKRCSTSHSQARGQIHPRILLHERFSVTAAGARVDQCWWAAVRSTERCLCRPPFRGPGMTSLFRILSCGNFDLLKFIYIFNIPITYVVLYKTTK